MSASRLCDEKVASGDGTLPVESGLESSILVDRLFLRDGFSGRLPHDSGERSPYVRVFGSGMAAVYAKGLVASL
jgi:hypothetical protein